MNFDIVLKRSPLGKVFISCMKATHQRSYYVLPNRSRLLDQHPLLKFEIEKHRSNLVFITEKTCFILLSGDALAVYYRDGKCMFDGQPLLSLGESHKKEQTFAKKLHELKFDPKFNSASYFLMKFQELMVDQVDSIIKTHLWSFIPIEDFEYFHLRWDQPLEELYAEFHRYYDGRAETIRADLEKLTLAQCSSVEEYFEKKLHYLNTYCSSILVAGKIKVLISYFPQEIRAEFAKVPGRILKKMDSFKSYLFELCRIHQSALLMKPIMKSDFMRQRLGEQTPASINRTMTSTPTTDRSNRPSNGNTSNINRPAASNDLNQDSFMAEEGLSRISYPGRLDYSAFLNDL